MSFVNVSGLTGIHLSIIPVSLRSCVRSLGILVMEIWLGTDYGKIYVRREVELAAFAFYQIGTLCAYGTRGDVFTNSVFTKTLLTDPTDVLSNTTFLE